MKITLFIKWGFFLCYTLLAFFLEKNLLRAHSSSKLVPQATVDGVILDSIETTDVVELGPELVALKAWEELRFTPMLEALGMNPSAIATA